MISAVCASEKIHNVPEYDSFPLSQGQLLQGLPYGLAIGYISGAVIDVP